MSSLKPRIVIVTRQTELEWLLSRHSTRGQVQFFLQSRDQSLEIVEARHAKQVEAVRLTQTLIPDDWTVTEVPRRRLDRFNFAPNDIIIAIGQDGLVANLAKYLSGQFVVGVSPDQGQYEGVLTKYSVKQAAKYLPEIAAGGSKFTPRTMVEARLDDGQSLIALNEIFIGHRSHQSARYVLDYNEREEFQSSSGLIVATGTGFTGWAKSILATKNLSETCGPEERAAHFFSREPWPSKNSGTSLGHGVVTTRKHLKITSRMNEGGVIFADGIEQDFLKFEWGMKSTIQISKKRLNLVRIE